MGKPGELEEERAQFGVWFPETQVSLSTADVGNEECKRSLVSSGEFGENLHPES